MDNAQPAPADPELAAELERMLSEDQAVFGPPPGTPAQKRETSLRQRTRLAQIVADQGWPTISQVGRTGAKAAWVTVQHADDDPEFQQRMLPILHEAAGCGEAFGSDVAFLVDRVLVNAGHPQRYGTQFHFPQGWPVPRPMEDPARVDERRAAMGMAPIAEYVRTARDYHRLFNPNLSGPPEDGWLGGETQPEL